MLSRQKVTNLRRLDISGNQITNVDALSKALETDSNLGVRCSTSGLAISANRLAIERPPLFADEGGVLLIDLR